jgi:DNA-binding winged helix-turn-helix (wHTH) protein
MPETSSVTRVIRFGAFEVDLRAGELRKNGLKIKLQEQPFQVLAMLLRHPGDVVTREELQKTVWPADTFVDFDRGLNKAVNKIGEALNDSADNSRFVETLPRRGKARA